VRRHHPWLPMPDLQAMRRAAGRVMGRYPVGEAPMTVGSVLHHWEDRLCDGVVVVSPWGCGPALARTSHHHSAAAWDPPAPSPRAPCGSLDVLQVRLRLPPVRATAKPLAPPGASLEAGEKSGLAAMLID
jgi:hypothetical protein